MRGIASLISKKQPGYVKKEGRGREGGEKKNAGRGDCPVLWDNGFTGRSG